MHKAFGGQARFLRIWPFLVAGTTKIVEGAFHDTEAQPFTERDFRSPQKTTRCMRVSWAGPPAAKR
jgi:hypothetical protein